MKRLTRQIAVTLIVAGAAALPATSGPSYRCQAGVLFQNGVLPNGVNCYWYGWSTNDEDRFGCGRRPYHPNDRNGARKYMAQCLEQPPSTIRVTASGDRYLGLCENQKVTVCNVDYDPDFAPW